MPTANVQGPFGVRKAALCTMSPNHHGWGLRRFHEPRNGRSPGGFQLGRAQPMRSRIERGRLTGVGRAEEPGGGDLADSPAMWRSRPRCGRTDRDVAESPAMRRTRPRCSGLASERARQAEPGAWNIPCSKRHPSRAPATLRPSDGTCRFPDCSGRRTPPSLGTREVPAGRGAGRCQALVGRRSLPPARRRHASARPSQTAVRQALALTPARARSLRIWPAASLPGAPMTQPPGCVPDPHW